MTEIITRNEVMNDGRTIHLYFNGFIGLYAAYGYSAYLLCENTKARISYSDDMQMPVVVINSVHLGELKNTLKVDTHRKGYYRFLVDNALNEDEYTEWANQVRRGEVL